MAGRRSLLKKRSVVVWTSVHQRVIVAIAARSVVVEERSETLVIVVERPRSWAVDTRFEHGNGSSRSRSVEGVNSPVALPRG